MRLSELRQYLKTHGEPPPNATEIGSGCFRTAYRVGVFVVKERQDRNEFDHRTVIRQFGLRKAPTVQVGNYEIQMAYKTVWEAGTMWHRPDGTDLHCDNIGVDKRGRLVAFDW